MHPRLFSHARRRWLIASVGVFLSLSLISTDLSASAADERLQDLKFEPEKLRALPSEPAPADRPQVPAGTFSKEPPTGEAAKDPHFDAEASAIVSRDAKRDTYKNPDGTYTARLYNQEVNFKDVSGKWKRIDPTLVSDGSGDYKNAAGPAEVTIDGSSSTNALAEVSKDDWSISFDLQGAASGKQAEVEDAEATYTNILPNIDLSYELGSTALKETVIVKARRNTKDDLELDFPFKTTGVRTVQEGQAVAFYDADGELAARIPPAVMVDDEGRMELGELSLSGSGSDRVLHLRASGVWLSQAAYPVRIDPSLTFSYTGEAGVFSNHPTTNFEGWNMGPIGYHATAGQGELYMWYDTSYLIGKNVLAATWSGHFSYSEQKPEPSAYYLHPINGAWTPGAVTWNNKPAWRSNTVYGEAAEGERRVVAITDWVKEWSKTSGGWTNYGIVAETASTATWRYKVISTSEESDATKRPYIQASWGSAAPVTSAVAPADQATVLTVTPELQATSVTDADGDPVSYYFRISSEPEMSEGQLTNSGWLSSPNWTVPKGSLQDGVTYYWQAYTSDGGSFTGVPWIRSFKVDLHLGDGGANPTDGVGPAHVNLATGNLSLSAGTPAYPTVGGDVGLTFNYNSLTPAKHGLTGTYYEDLDEDGIFETGEEVMTRLDPSIDFEWGYGSPGAAISPDDFGAIWTGYITVPTTGTYTFGSSSDDGVMIWVGENLVVNRWFEQVWDQSISYGTPVNLTAGQKVPFAVAYFESEYKAAMKLAVKGPGLVDVPVPASWLSTEPSSLPQGWSVSADLDGALAYDRAVVTDKNVVLVSPNGSTHEYVRLGTGFSPPPGEDGILTSDAATGNLTLHDVDGMTYVFGSDGRLLSATTATDDLNPAAQQYSYGGSPVRLQSITDPVSQRSVALTYGGGTCPSAPSGFDASPPSGMLCKISYWDGRDTKLFYVSAQLARIEDPGAELTDFSYADGRITQIRDSLAADAIAAGQRTDDATTRTLVSYDQGRVSSVELPAPTSGAPRPKRTYAYNTGYSTVDVAGMSGSAGYDRRVDFDAKGRTTADRGPDGLATTFTWDSEDRLISQTDPADRKSTTIYDPDRGWVTDEYGPAPSSWYGTDNKPLSGYVSQVPHSETKYDEGLTSLASTFWKNKDMSGQPACHDTGIGGTGGQIFKDWAAGSPSCLGSTVNNWSARLTGEITMDTPGTYYFVLYADEGVRLWLDDEIVIDKWNATGGGFSQAISSPGNERRRIRIESFDGSGNALLLFNWYKPGQGEAIVPGSALAPRFSLVTSEITQDAQAGDMKTSTAYSTDHLGLPTSVTQDPGGLHLSTQTAYTDSAGLYRRSSRTLPAGNQWIFEYYTPTETLGSTTCGLTSTTKQAGLLKKRTGPDPDGPQGPRVEEFVYDVAGRAVGRRVGTDDWSCATFDSRGRVSSQAHPAFGDEPARTVTYNYSVGGNPLVGSANDPAGTLTTTVDLLGRTISYTDVWGNTTVSAYDQVGRLTQSSGPDGTHDFVFDSGTGRLLTQKFGGQPIAVLAYNTSGELESVQYPSGTGNAGNGSELDAIHRDALGRATSLRWLEADDDLLAADEVVRSQSGRVTEQRIDNGPDPYPSGNDFSYDAAGRLIAARVPGHTYTYAFASSGGCGSLATAGKNTNRTSMIVDGQTATTYCYDNTDRLTQTNDSRYTSIAYDAHGNTTTLGAESMSYDSLDRHVETVKGSATIRYARDATGRIVERKVNGATVARYGYSSGGDQPAFTLNALNQVIEGVVELPGGVLVTKRAGSEIWNYPNLHGDVVATANSAGAKQGSSLSYSPFGEVLAAVPDNLAGEFDLGWLGMGRRPSEHEAGIETMEMGARPYVPGLGRFLTVDPVEGGSANDYEYAGQDCLNHADPDGHSIRKLYTLVCNKWYGPPTSWARSDPFAYIPGEPSLGYGQEARYQWRYVAYMDVYLVDGTRKYYRYVVRTLRYQTRYTIGFGIPIIGPSFGFTYTQRWQWLRVNGRLVMEHLYVRQVFSPCTV